MRIFVNESTGQKKIAAELGTNKSRGNMIDRNLGDMANISTPRTPAKDIAKREFATAIEEAMAILSKSEQKVIKMRFGMGDDGNPPMSPAEIAEACNADVELVKRIEHNALAKIRDHANGSALGEYGNRVAAYVGRLLSAQTVNDGQQSSVVEEPRKWRIKVTFDDGDVLETWINGTQEEIRRHYLGNEFVLADETTMHRPTSVEFLEDLGDVPWTYHGEKARPKEAQSLWELTKISQFVPTYRDRPDRTHEMPRHKPLELPEGATYIDSGYWELPGVVAKRLCGGTLPKPGYERIVEFGGSKWAIHETPVRGELAWGLRWIKNLDSEASSQGG